jgi:hypothetical protein
LRTDLILHSLAHPTRQPMVVLPLIALLLLTLTPRAELIAQARPPVPIASDSTGVLSAIRAIDIRQVCRCPVVLVDSTVRRSPNLKVFGLLSQPVAFRLTTGEVARLGLARHRAVPAALTTITLARPDTALLVAQVVPTRPPGARVLVVVTPPNGLTASFLVSLIARGPSPRRASWRVTGVRSVYEP